MVRSSRLQFTKEFKLDTAGLVSERGYSVAHAAFELGVSAWSLRNWIAKLKTSGDLKVHQQTESVAEELKQLQAESQRLRLEKETLKGRPELRPLSELRAVAKESP